MVTHNQNLGHDIHGTVQIFRVSLKQPRLFLIFLFWSWQSFIHWGDDYLMCVTDSKAFIRSLYTAYTQHSLKDNVETCVCYLGILFWSWVMQHWVTRIMRLTHDLIMMLLFDHFISDTMIQCLTCSEIGLKSTLFVLVNASTSSYANFIFVHCSTFLH